MGEGYIFSEQWAVTVSLFTANSLLVNELQNLRGDIRFYKSG